MRSDEFAQTLHAAMDGNERALEKIFALYEPLFFKYALIKGKYSEDLHQQLLLHIALNIHKFPL